MKRTDMTVRAIVLMLPVFVLMPCARVHSQSSTIELEPVLSGLSSPLYITSAHDRSNRLFIVEQGGRIKVLEPGGSSPSVFLDISFRVLAGGERGLLGLAFHPKFTTNRRFFVDYTRSPDGATVIAEYHASPSGNVAETSETVLLVIPQPFANHKGGMIEFGPDGYLYIGMGDGGSANDPGNRAQNIDELLGKILRIDVDKSDGLNPYSSPPDNPFAGSVPGRDEIYALGLRNPWRFSFDRATGQLYVGDVGQNAWEEVDIVTAGGNYGWRITEGNHCNQNISGSCNTSGLIMPIVEYGHTGGRCSITGGYVYRGSKATLPIGTYVYGDYCSGEIFGLTGGAQKLLLDTSLNISSFGEDEAGEIYVVGLGGTVAKLINPNAPRPQPLMIRAALVYRRSKGEPLQPIAVRNNGKKFEVVVLGTGFVTGSVIMVNGRELSTELRPTEVEEIVLAGRLKADMLSQPGTLTIEVVNPDGVRSNKLMLEVVAQQ